MLVPLPPQHVHDQQHLPLHGLVEDLQRVQQPIATAPAAWTACAWPTSAAVRLMAPNASLAMKLRRPMRSASESTLLSRLK